MIFWLYWAVALWLAIGANSADNAGAVAFLILSSSIIMLVGCYVANTMES